MTHPDVLKAEQELKNEYEKAQAGQKVSATRRSRKRKDGRNKPAPLPKPLLPWLGKSKA